MSAIFSARLALIVFILVGLLCPSLCMAEEVTRPASKASAKAIGGLQFANDMILEGMHYGESSAKPQIINVSSQAYNQDSTDVATANAQATNQVKLASLKRKRMQSIPVAEGISVEMDAMAVVSFQKAAAGKSLGAAANVSADSLMQHAVYHAPRNDAAGMDDLLGN